MRIALVGFMGTGKSSVARLVALELDYKYLDTDKLIEQREGMDIPQIFSRYGEEYFRQQESKVLQDVIEGEERLVLSTGGGIVISPANRKLLEKSTLPVLLEASPQIIYERVKNSDRPLLKMGEGKVLNKIKELLAERRRYYHQFNFRINTDHKNQREVAEEIIKRVKEDGSDK